MSNALKTPDFISENKSFASYERDLRRWSRLTTLDKKKQAEWIVLHLEGHPSGIKEKIETQLGDTLEDNEKGIEDLINFFRSIYETDELADSFEKYMNFEKLRRDSKTSVQTFIATWENMYHKTKNAGCELTDMVLAFKLLYACSLSEMEIKLVLTGVDYKVGKEKSSLLAQTKESLKKFVGRTIIGQNEDKPPPENTFITREEMVLMLKQSQQNKKKERRRSKSLPPDRDSEDSKPGYKGRKNPLGSDMLPLKCFRCKCSCEKNCNHGCRYHLLNNCPMKSKASTEEKKDKKQGDMTLFGNVNVPTFFTKEESYDDEEDEVFVAENLTYLLGKEVVFKNKALVDCACPRTVAGLEWVKSFMEGLSKDERSKINLRGSTRVFRFGGGETRKSLYVVDLPCLIANRKIKLRTEVVAADIPLLLGNTTLKKAKVSIHFGDMKANMFGNNVDLAETESGHFSIKIEAQKEQNYESDILTYLSEEYPACSQINKESICLILRERELSFENVQKLHHYFGHCSKEKLENLIKRAGKMSKGVKEFINNVYDNCEACNVITNRKPKPAVAIPVAKNLNDIVTIDLKEYGSGAHKYIVYAIDRFSRLTVGKFIGDKKPETIGSFLMEKWISVFGRMRMLHSDRGGEFVNEDITRLAEYLDVKLTNTAAHSPNQNGCNERNHAVVDRMIQRMIFMEPSMNPEVALAWALCAKNSLENVHGYSPFQLVFGESPALPAIYCSGPPGLEEAKVSPKIAEHIQAMHTAREAFIHCENDSALKTALRKRCFLKAKQIEAGDWIYFKNDRKWEGPVRVTTKDGKLLYAIRAGRLLTINSDHANISKCAEAQIHPEKEREAGSDKVPEEENLQVENAHEGVENLLENNSENRENDVDPNVGGEEGEGRVPINIPDEAVAEPENIPNNEEENTVRRRGWACPSKYGRQDKSNWCKACVAKKKCTTPVNQNVTLEEDVVLEEAGTDGLATDNEVLHVRAQDHEIGDVVKFINDGGNQRTGEIVSRVGMIGGKFENWVRIRDVESNHISIINIENTENSKEENVNHEEEAYVVIIPRYLHNEKRCREAKEEELQKFLDFEVYSECIDEGQPRLGTNWVLTEKVTDEGTKVKARLTVRGDQEDSDQFRKDSPTIRKSNIKVLLSIAAMNGWKIKSSDVTAAFLQSVPIERDVYVLPPKERRVPGMLWKLKKPCYGLADASRGFYLSFSGEVKDLGCSGSHLDPAMFILKEEDDKVHGMMVSHVDDVLHAGDDVFETSVMKPLKETFQFGSEDQLEFRYVGMKIEQTSDAIVVDYVHYINNLEVPDSESQKTLVDSNLLDADGQSEFRSLVAKLNTIAYQCRPDIVFGVKILNSKVGKATLEDFKEGQRKMRKVKILPMKLVFPKLGNIEELFLLGHGDAAIKSMPDKTTSVGGHVIMLCNERTQQVCVLNWRSKKIRRVVNSSLAGEALATADTIGELVYQKAILVFIFGENMKDLPVIAATDSQNLHTAVQGTSLIEDAWTIPDIACIKEAVEKKVINDLLKVRGEDMLANCLTKKGAGGAKLMEVLRTGKYKIPDDVKYLKA